MADAWLYNYTDFGEGRGRSPQPVLRAVVEVATPHAPATFQAVIDTGGPITVVAAGLLDTGGHPVATGTTMMLRLGGATHDVPIYDLTLEVRPPPAVAAGQPISWRVSWRYSTRGRCKAPRSCSGRLASSMRSR
ncbi:MAG TPA: hypothetical protein VES40_00075 [Ilumatobacteraceae bacterium]|nr:hypothetical protein [Ilumatobacteraceae bacterium]